MDALVGRGPGWSSRDRILVVSAQTLRAVLLASAVATTFFGLRANIPAIRGSVISPRQFACWTTAMAPVTRSRLRDPAGPS